MVSMKIATAKRSNFARETTTNRVHFQWFTMKLYVFLNLF